MHPSSVPIVAAALTAAVAGMGAGAAAADWPQGCERSTLAGEHSAEPEEQIILTCLPKRSNGHLIVYAHGYVPPQEPLRLPLEELENGVVRTTIRRLLDLGFAFATTSYHKNGYAIEQAGQDLRQLIRHVTAQENDIDRVWLVGASEGGLVATMLVEREPSLVDGGLAMCAPLGGALRQVGHLADVRLVFDQLFPDVFPFGLADTPATAWDDWEKGVNFKGRVRRAIEAAPDAAEDLVRVTDIRCPVEQRVACIQSLLAYGLSGRADLEATAGGWPYGNRRTVYRGSGDDATLNRQIERLAADAAAKRYVERFYHPRGRLQRQLVTLHTTEDHLVPIWHEREYEKRVKAAGRSNRLSQLEFDRAGHCRFAADEILGGLALVILREDGDVPLDMLDYLARLAHLDEVDDAARDRLANLVDRVDGSVKKVGDKVGDLADNAKDAVRDTAKKLF
jgi:pimeloyl-ACP methyl ester carboxylesterase